ncbi:S9 family peptidase [uncultured Lactobacillus sp.]|uniref:alpha/beta hydrolase family protein n=1 Tax=uncultured Lactobacillus sp. TaxID=153152 RepID=UPI00260C1F4C|nr:S9 family peptidase [uncultured Lactobacillus sp.]
MEAVKVEDLYQVVSLGNLQASGQRAVLARNQAKVDGEGYWNWLDVFENGQLKRLTTLGQEKSYALVNNSVYYTAQEGKGNCLLYKQELDQASPAKVAAFKEAGYQVINSVASRYLLLSRRVDLAEKKSTDYQVLDELPYYFNGQGYINKLRDRLYVWDLEEEKLTELFKDDPSFTVMETFVAKEKVYVVGVSYQTRRPSDGAVYEVDPSTGEAKLLLAAGKAEVSAIFALKGQVYCFANTHKKTGLNENPEFYRLTEKGPELAAHWDNSGQSAIAGDCGVIGSNSFDVYGDKFYFVTTIVDHDEIYVFDGQEVKPFFATDGIIKGFRLTGEDEFFLEAAFANELLEFYLVKNGHVEKLSSYNDQALTGKYVAKVNEVEYESVEDGIQHGWVLLPKDYQAGKKYPAILDVHGGPRATYSKAFFHEMQVWAGAGYFVFFCNIHGSNGQGNQYGDLRGRYGTVDYEDLMKFTDAVLAAYPDIDQTRLGITGGSYGGFMTNWVIGHTDRFKAAASQRSISNWLSFEHMSDIAPEFCVDQVGASEDDDPEKVWLHSPLKYVKNVKTPTLFLNSDEDYRCPVEEGMQMFHALVSHGVESRMVVFHGENHELSRSGRPKNRLSRLNEIQNWFDGHLGK